MKKLNIGCFNDVREGYINLDKEKAEGVDVVHDLEVFPYKDFEENQFEEILALSVIEHIDSNKTIKVFEELHRISKDKCIIKK